MDSSLPLWYALSMLDQKKLHDIAMMKTSDLLRLHARLVGSPGEQEQAVAAEIDRRIPIPGTEDAAARWHEAEMIHHERVSVGR